MGHAASSLRHIAAFGRRTACALAALLAFAGPVSAEPSEAYEIATVAEGLDHPWGIAFLPGGDMLVTERAGRLRIIRNGTLDPEPVGGLPAVFGVNQGGLMGLAIHPDFETNRLVYISYAEGTAAANATVLVRGRFDGRSLQDVEPIFRAQPEKKAAAHFGGRIQFLPDMTLLLTLGDGFNYREDAQLLSSHLGKIVRLNDDGSVPADNPFSDEDGIRPEIFSYGHRNVQGIAYDPIHNVIYAHEHGPAGGDELNIIEAGENYGWPIATHGLDYTGAKISPFTEYEGTVQPAAYWVPSIAPSGMTVYTGTAFPSWTGDIFVSALIAGDAGKDDIASGHVRRFDVANGRLVGSGNNADAERLFGEVDERIRHVATGPDGMLYLLAEGNNGDEQPVGRVLRVTPAR